jgi:hypothetical protein
MSYTLIRGTFRAVGFSPDGDSVRFAPDDVDLVNNLPGAKKVLVPGNGARKVVPRIRLISGPKHTAAALVAASLVMLWRASLASAAEAATEKSGEEKERKEVQAAKAATESTKEDSANDVALAKNGRLLQYGVTGGIALSVQSPFPSLNGVALESPKVAAMPYVAMFPAYWFAAQNGPKRVYCSSTGWLDKDDEARRAATAKSRQTARIVFERHAADVRKAIVLRTPPGGGPEGREEAIENAIRDLDDAFEKCVSSDCAPRTSSDAPVAAACRAEEVKRDCLTRSPKDASYCVAAQNRCHDAVVSCVARRRLLPDQRCNGQSIDLHIAHIIQKTAEGSLSRSNAESDLIASIAATVWQPESDAPCSGYRFGAWVGRPFDFEADVTIGGSRGPRQLSPIVAFGATYMPNSYLSLMHGFSYNTIYPAEAAGETRGAWSMVFALGGTLDVARLLSP